MEGASVREGELARAGFGQGEQEALRREPLMVAEAQASRFLVPKMAVLLDEPGDAGKAAGPPESAIEQRPPIAPSPRQIGAEIGYGKGLRRGRRGLTP